MTHFKQGAEANGRARNKPCFIFATYIDFLVPSFGGKLHDAQNILWTSGFLLLFGNFQSHMRWGGGLNFVSVWEWAVHCKGWIVVDYGRYLRRWEAKWPSSTASSPCPWSWLTRHRFNQSLEINYLWAPFCGFLTLYLCLPITITHSHNLAQTTVVSPIIIGEKPTRPLRPPHSLESGPANDQSVFLMWIYKIEICLESLWIFENVLPRHRA